MKNLQEGLNALVGHKLPALLEVDGIIGRRSREAIEVLRNDVQAIFKRKGYIWNDKGNLIAIRRKERRQDKGYKFTNRFIDIGLITLGDNEVAYDMSTLAGLYGSGNVLSPRWIDGVFGVGVVKEGQYRGAYQLNGAWWSGLKFLLQIATFEFYRDGNLDTNFDRGVVYKGIKGFNYHSWKNKFIGLFKSLFVNSLSQGCMVTEGWIWENIVLPYLEQLAIIYNNAIDFTLINEDDFILS